jgi:hypothetical protein
MLRVRLPALLISCPTSRIYRRRARQCRTAPPKIESRYSKAAGKEANRADGFALSPRNGAMQAQTLKAHRQGLSNRRVMESVHPRVPKGAYRSEKKNSTSATQETR